MTRKTIRIGTRSSKLALFQTNMVAKLLRKNSPNIQVDIVEINTSGDWRPEHGEKRLSEVQGGKGLFAKEIEQAILEGHVDCGVHSMKDMPSFLPEGLKIEHVLERADPRDVLLSKDNIPFEDLPEGALIGSSSTRRASFLLNKRPDLKIVPIRGNVPTRIQKLRSGQVDATVLAAAGLERLDLMHEAQSILEPEFMLPAAGQGIIGVEIRDGDDELSSILDIIHDQIAGICVLAERAVLQVLDGSCQTPIGAYAEYDKQSKELYLRSSVAALDGSNIEHFEIREKATNNEDAIMIGTRTGDTLKSTVPSEWLQKAC